MIDEPATAAESTPAAQLPTADTSAQLAELHAQQPPPRANAGAMPTPESADFMDRALRDPEFYAQNREKVMSAWNVCMEESQQETGLICYGLSICIHHPRGHRSF
jgi:hypothetical protein